MKRACFLILLALGPAIGPATAEDAPAENVAQTSAVAEAKPAGPAETPAAAEPTEREIIDAQISKNVTEVLQSTLEMVRTLRFQKNYDLAEKQVSNLLGEDTPLEIRRQSMLEMAYICQDTMQLSKAQQIYNEYARKFPKDPSLPEVCLRQGTLYRQMGAHNLALAKYYQVLNYSLNLKLDRLEYYQALVIKAQTEIAETYYLQGKFADSVEYFSRLLTLDSKGLDRAGCLFKLVRSLAAQQEHARAAAQGQAFLQLYPDSTEVAEVRFLLADSLKKLGRNRESMQQVLLLLQSQQKQAQKHPELWAYWQQRTGNEIANQLYKEGDYMSALEIYLGLAKISAAPAWQLPVWYQIGLVYEHLKQPQKADEMYDQILKRQVEVRTDAGTPGLIALLDMALWRRNYLKWGDKADKSLQTLNVPAPPEERAPEVSTN